MFMKERIELLPIYKIGVSLVQGNIIRVTLLSELIEPVVPIKGKEKGVFVPASELGVKLSETKISLRSGLWHFLQCFGVHVKAYFRTGRASNRE